MHKQVITVDPNGIISGLQRKPGQGLDLTKFGKADVQRASEIVWDADHQRWKIDVLQEAGRGVVTIDTFCEAGLHPKDVAALGVTTDIQFDGPVMLFATYDDAVKIEIAYLDALRIRGLF